MIRIIANVSKKVPIRGVDYSSIGFAAGVELEMADTSTAEDLRSRLTKSYALLETVIDNEIATREKPSAVVVPMQQKARGNNRQTRPSTEAQRHTLFALARESGMTREEFDAWLEETYGVDTSEDLDTCQASQAIHALKQRRSA